MTNMIEKFKENKKVMVTKMEMANKMADEAANEFVDSLRPLVENSSDEDIEMFLKSDDDMINPEDKMAVIAILASIRKSISGAIIIDIIKK